MSQSIKARGRCLCGAVTIEADSMSTDVGACHCDMCKKWTGGPLLAVDCEDKITMTGKENITIYPSSERAERAFCSKCGTHFLSAETECSIHCFRRSIRYRCKISFGSSEFYRGKARVLCLCQSNKELDWCTSLCAVL